MSNSKQQYKHKIINKQSNYNWMDKKIKNVNNQISKGVHPILKTNA